MSAHLRRLRRTAALMVAVAGLSATVSRADEWLVYLGGGLEPIEGSWTEKRGRVIFTKAGGTLVSVPFEDLDLAASTFITWQLDGRRNVPPRAALERLPPLPEGTSPPSCLDARLVRMFGPESLEIASGEQREIVHVACLDSPETRHEFAALGWFGRAAKSALETEVKPGAALCVTEQIPPRRDGQGHRIVYAKLADGRDLATMVIAGGFGLLRPTQCRDGAHYRATENSAIKGQRGLWGESGAPAAFQAVRIGAASAAPGSRVASGGCRLR